MSRFASIKSERSARAPEPTVTPASSAAPPASTPERPAAREGKKAVSGYFSAELRRALHQLRLEQGMTLQAMMGEAFDDLLRKYGKHPFGER
jgi:hypothetical protein